MNLNASNIVRRAPRSISAVFILLAVSLQMSLAIYWSQVLEPKLRSEAEADSKVISEAQSSQLINALLDFQQNEDSSPLEEALDRLMLYQEPSSGSPFFRYIELEFDSESFPQVDSIVRGEKRCSNCFKVDVALYSPDSFVLLGIAHFKVSDTFFQVLARDIRNQLFIQGGITLALLLLAWFTAVLLIRSLQKETLLRKASEEALSENQKKYHRLISSLSHYFVYTRDHQGQITFVSDTVSDLYGYTPSQMQKLHELLTPNPINNVARQYLKAPAKSSPQIEFEIEILDHLGERRWILLSEINLYDETGRFLGVEGLGRDISKQKQIEADLVEAKEQAEIANKAKGLFLANMSHEIRTPMNAIVGNIYLLQKTMLNERQKKFSKRIESSSQVLLQLVNDILDISKIEAGKLELENIEFALSDVFDNLSNVVVTQAQKKQLDIIYDIAEDTPQHLIGDPLRLNQVLLNLVNNAIKFTDKGEIIIEVSVTKSGPAGVTLLFSVKDEGIGITETKQAELFKSFNQVDNSVTRKFGGTGLGLAICQHLVTMMGGDIGVESKFGKGSTFFFTINAGIKPDSVTPPAQVVDTTRALLIDDSPNATRVLQNMLVRMGVSVSVAHTGEYGLELITDRDPHHHYDLIFIDYNMPSMNGYEVAEKIKSLALNHEPPLILVTASDIEHLDKTKVEALFSDVLFKPFTQSSLLDSVAATRQVNQLAPSPVVKATKHSFSGGKVLLVEDNLINQEVAIALLEDVDISVVLAENGQEALDKLTQETFDLILMDVQMPVMDGLTAASKIKHELKLATPIIAMTANAMDEDRDNAQKAGMLDFITKPLDVSSFYDTLGKWLAGQTSPNNLSNLQDYPDITGVNVPDALKRVGNKQTLLLSLLREFVDGYRNFAAQLRTANDSNDVSAQLAMLHRLKGESGNISITQVHQASCELESSLKQHQTLNETQLDEFELLLNNTIHAIKESVNNIAELHSKTNESHGSVVNLKDLTSKIDVLLKQLEKQELGAVETGEALVNELPDWIDNDLVEDLHSHIRQLEFNEASGLAKQLKKQLKAKKEHD